MKFRSPKRRAVRQRSGYTVSGEKTGSEAVVLESAGYRVRSSSFSVRLENPNAELTPQFEHEIGIAAIGGYVLAEQPVTLEFSLIVKDPVDGGTLAEKTRSRNLTSGSWQKFGLHVELEDPRSHLFVHLEGVVTVENPTGASVGDIHFFGVAVDTVQEFDSEAILDNFGDRAFEVFQTKTGLYYPEIFYWPHDAPFAQDPQIVNGFAAPTAGKQIVNKACNRCSRFLPIDLAEERNVLSFSNHCIKRAPCVHEAFSNYRIENLDELHDAHANTLELEQELRGKVSEKEGSPSLAAQYGFQLECRSCKKFFVNAPLNPMRNSAQRREDSLRRRALEALLRELLGHDWIFYKFRRERKGEFDRHIWEKFDRACFACGKELPSPKDMDLDHTLPLVYLWPLDEGATCLCSRCNSQKHDKFPFEFERYKEPGKLELLAEITGRHEDILLSRQKHLNPVAVAALKLKVEWLFDDFLARDDYQKVREGKLTADLILASLQRVLDECGANLNLVDAYRRDKSDYPSTVSIYP